MAKKIVKYEIDDFSQYTTETLLEKMEMYLGKMQILNFKQEDTTISNKYKVKKWFSISLNMYNISKEIHKRTEEKEFNPSLN